MIIKRNPKRKVTAFREHVLLNIFFSKKNNTFQTVPRYNCVTNNLNMMNIKQYEAQSSSCMCNC